MIVGVDLAAKFSAAVVLDEDGEVIDQFDSWDRPTDAFVGDIANWMIYRRSPLRLVIEDVPYGISSQAMVKTALRLQGYILGHMANEADLDFARIHFVIPSTWQRYFPGVWKGAKEGAAERAAQFGYSPPDTLALYGDKLRNAKGKLLKKHSDQLEKVQTDYVDAFLIAQFAFEVGDKITDFAGIQPFYL